MLPWDPERWRRGALHGCGLCPCHPLAFELRGGRVPWLQDKGSNIAVLNTVVGRCASPLPVILAKPGLDRMPAWLHQRVDSG